MLVVDDARRAVRLTTEEFDDELTALIGAAKADLETAGVVLQENDALYDHAIRMYIKGYFEMNAPEAEAARVLFENLKGTMKLIDKYRGASG